MNNIAKLSTAAAVAALVIGVAGCGSSSSGSGGNGTSTLAPAAATKNVAASTLQSKSTKIGTVLVNSKGLTIYELVGDTATNQKCNSSCQAFWPPVMSGGSQLVINGHPAFTFANDSAAGQVHGQNSKDTWGTWLALDASGNPIAAATTTTASPTATSSSGSGGYGY